MLRLVTATMAHVDRAHLASSDRIGSDRIGGPQRSSKAVGLGGEGALEQQDGVDEGAAREARRGGELQILPDELARRRRHGDLERH